MFLDGIGDIEIIPGWKLDSFPWYLSLYVLAGFILVFGVFYFIYVWVLGRLKFTKDEELKYKETKEKFKKLKGNERKQELKNESKPVNRVLKWNKIKVPTISILSCSLIVCLLAVPTLTVAWDLIKFTLNPDKHLDNDSESARLAIGEAKENVVTLEQEGMVLLKNDDDVLPLNKEENNKINVFGSSAFGMLYGGGGSGVFITNANYGENDFHATRLEKALVEEGFEYNTNLYNLVANYYESKSYKITKTDYDISCQFNAYGTNVGNYIAPTKFPYDNEPEVSSYNKIYDGLDGKTLLENAKNYSSTALYCVSRAGSEDHDFSRSDLQLTSRENDMINMLKDNFEKVIILINSSNVMELGALNQKGIDSVLWIGHPGLTGNKAVAQAISGKINPSGKLVDTWPYDITTSPSFASFGPDSTLTYSNKSANFVEYLEGIYVGYRYYVTRANDDTNFKYEDYVQYSFGEGLSYTKFEKYINDYTVDLVNQKISIQVAVKNIGNVAGKEVVEIYNTAPYTSRIEKSHVELVGFEKTNLIEPNETFYARINIDLKSLASWDNENGYYLLEKGDYVLSLRDNAYKLSEVPQNKDNLINFNLKEDINYLTSDTNEKYQTRLFDVEFGPNSTPIEYLSRSNWNDTFPTKNKINKVASDKTINASKNKTYADNQIKEDLPAQGVDYGNDKITMAMMKNVDYNDEKWDKFLNQLSITDMENLVDNGGFQTAEIKSISKRTTYDDDGPASVQIKGTGYTSEVVVASSWNPECAKLLGESLGKEGASMGLTGWYAPGMNIHRCPTGGRNFEYYSEDPLITGVMGAMTSIGTSKYGVYTYAKHFALNEQEQNRIGLEVWANEQSIREIYLKGFEIYVKEGKALGIMSSFSRIGGVWSGAQNALLNDILRNEWGFKGVVGTDWCYNSLMPVNSGLRGGNDLWLLRNASYSAHAAYLEAPHDTTILLRRASKHILYAISQSNGCWSEKDYEDVGVKVDFSKAGWDNI